MMFFFSKFFGDSFKFNSRLGPRIQGTFFCLPRTCPHILALDFKHFYQDILSLWVERSRPSLQIPGTSFYHLKTFLRNLGLVSKYSDLDILLVKRSRLGPRILGTFFYLTGTYLRSLMQVIEYFQLGTLLLWAVDSRPNLQTLGTFSCLPGTFLHSPVQVSRHSSLGTLFLLIRAVFYYLVFGSELHS